jgi:hypothetical protein
MVALACGPMQTACADDAEKANIHTQTWNRFVDQIMELHKTIIHDHDVVKSISSGGYSDHPEYYFEEDYRYKDSGQLVSRIQWERKYADILHSIEVYVRDKKGRVKRDYSATYSPSYRSAPTQTLISLYHYNGKLKAYRTFDASGYRIGERCVGVYKGKKVDLILDEDEIIDALYGESDIMEQPAYRACFKGLAEKPGKYLKPQ